MIYIQGRQPDHSGERIENAIGDTFTGVMCSTKRDHWRLYGQENRPFKEIKTAWHSELQARFVREGMKYKHEVPYITLQTQQLRRADIIYDNRIIVELQHSPLKSEQQLERHRNALENYEKCFWLFDIERFKPYAYNLSSHGYQGIFEDLKEAQVRSILVRHSTPPTWILPYVETEAFYSKWKNIHEGTFGVPATSELFPRHEELFPEMFGSWLKQYSGLKNEDLDPEIWIHIWNEYNLEAEEPQFFLKLEKVYNRKDAASNLNIKGLQKRGPYVSKFSVHTWEEFVEHIEK